MSVNLMELKVPENAPRVIRDQINIGLTFRQTAGMANRWVEICAVAALYWRQAEQEIDDKIVTEYAVSEASREESLRSYEAYEQANLWQRAAFEGVEP